MLIPEHGKTEKVSSSHFHQEPETSRTLSQNNKEKCCSYYTCPWLRKISKIVGNHCAATSQNMWGQA